MSKTYHKHICVKNNYLCIFKHKYRSYFVHIKYNKDVWFVHSTAFRKCIYDVTSNVLRPHRFQKT